MIPPNTVRRLLVVLAFALVAAACGNGSDPAGSAPSSTVAATAEAVTTVAVTTVAATTEAPATEAPATEGVAIPPTGGKARSAVGFEFPPAPDTPDGLLDDAVVGDLDLLFADLSVGVDFEALNRIGDSGDARVAWLMADLLRFVGQGAVRDASVDAFERLTGTRLADDPVAARSIWQSATDHLIAWDLPAPPAYPVWKGQLFLLFDAQWAPFFEDTDAEIDWRFLSWGGVRLDSRPLGATLPCPLGCIPALDDPAVTDAAGGDWYPDDAIVFAVVVNGESRAYPKNIMEIHEMVNDTLGGRRLGIPYCTLCGSAQAYFTDSVPDGVEVPVLRTSGLLSRSNKVMFDLNTFSVFDTFTGKALSGPLHDDGIVLDQTTIVTSRWGDWKTAHPDTTIVAEDGGIGRRYPLDPLGGRDDDGPIFPVGDVDERLPVQMQVLGVETADGTTIAFPVDQARAALDAGEPVQLLGISLVPEGSGVRAEGADGTPLVSHQSFWFAWSQFHPETLVWAPPVIGGG